MKTYYGNSKTQLFQEDAKKMAKKVEKKIIKAFYFASYNVNIFSGWEEYGIQLHFTIRNVSKATINPSKRKKSKEWEQTINNSIKNQTKIGKKYN